MKRNRKNIQLWLVVGLLVMSALYSLVMAYAVLKGHALSDQTNFLWMLIFALLIALWAKNDAESMKNYKPYEYSYFVFLLWPVVLPYHLIKNRGVEGFVLFLGFVAAYCVPFFVGLITWAYFTK